MLTAPRFHTAAQLRLAVNVHKQEVRAEEYWWSRHRSMSATNGTCSITTNDGTLVSGVLDNGFVVEVK